MTMTIACRTLPLLSLALVACGQGGGGYVVDEVAAMATANCEASTSALRAPNAEMLPGRICGACHRAGGQADHHIWTVAGTVYGSPSASCNSGGLAGVKVEILKMNGSVQATLTTNRVGNFFTSQPIEFPIRVRLSKDGKMAEMISPQRTGACASCHQNPGLSGAPGRVYLN
ncbi:MAG: hypothetical protein RMK29_14105 [Myxococcales bacterium]|nr:cytochrome-c peroxidase [Myxococcota bacterium]MDW8282844.1 hypothetical protein [Myxococcales bacterium]